ncbi:MAG: ATP-binding protein [Neisseria sp.]|nr:MAG: ATP-binding protein [Neisseria sp.]DAK42611.1 MAG TPA: Replicative helicase [Bacteriophage sp.]
MCSDMATVGEILKGSHWFTPISETEKRCEKHGIDYTEQVFKHFVRGCPKCREEEEAERERQAEAEREAERRKWVNAQIERRIGASKIPPRFVGKTVKGYEVSEGNEGQRYVADRVKAYAIEFNDGKHSGRCLALLGNAGTGKTHLACAIGNHLLKNLGKTARFTTVSELNRIVREAKSFSSDVTESQVIADFAGYDLLIIDEVGVQTGTDAESKALFDVFNERYQNLKPTVLISNLDAAGFVQAVGRRIADRVKEDGGEILSFDWESHRA